MAETRTSLELFDPSLALPKANATLDPTPGDATGQEAGTIWTNTITGKSFVLVLGDSNYEDPDLYAFDDTTDEGTAIIVGPANVTFIYMLFQVQVPSDLRAAFINGSGGASTHRVVLKESSAGINPSGVNLGAGTRVVTGATNLFGSSFSPAYYTMTPGIEYALIFEITTAGSFTTTQSPAITLPGVTTGQAGGGALPGVFRTLVRVDTDTGWKALDGS